MSRPIAGRRSCTSAWCRHRRPWPSSSGCSRSRAGSAPCSTEHRPTAMAIERVFAQHNLRTVMGTAQASGVALALGAEFGLAVGLHTPSEVKAAITGYGAAEKAQVGTMVARVLGLDAVPRPGGCGGRARPGDLSWLARWSLGGRIASPRPQRGSDRLDSCATCLAAAERHSGVRSMISSVRGTVLTVAGTVAVIEVGGVGLGVQVTPAARPHPARRSGGDALHRPDRARRRPQPVRLRHARGADGVRPAARCVGSRAEVGARRARHR